jgi:riboflavin kinase
VSKEALVEDIREDIRVARRSLEREGYEKWRGDAWLFEKEENKEEEKAEEVETHEVKRKQFGRGQVDGVAKCEMMP